MQINTSLQEKLLKASPNKYKQVFDDSKVLESEMTMTRVPILNLALSGQFKGGLSSGLTILAGPSKHFKSNLGTILVQQYLDKYSDAICLFFDSEFGTKKSYFLNSGVDPKRINHYPITNVEQFKFDIVSQLEAIERGEKVIIYIDSIGNMSSIKELEDAIEGKSVADMSRAKALKSLFRIITPYLTLKDIPCVAINHTIQTMEMFSKQVMTGGTGIQYSADTTLFIGKSQIKEGTELTGYNFTLMSEKSRYVKEKSKFPLVVTYEGGVSTFSGLYDLAIELGFIIKPTTQSHKRCFMDPETGELVPEELNWKRKDLDCIEFWKDLIQHKPFLDACDNEYILKTPSMSEATKNEIDELLFG